MNRTRVLIFGCNQISREVASQLADRGWELTLVSDNGECLEHAEKAGFEVSVIDYTNDDALRSLGIGSGIEVVFTLFEEDSKNVFLVISTKYIDPELRVISLCQSQDAAGKLRAAGANKVIDPYTISGRKIYSIIKQPLVTETIDDVVFGRQHLSVAEMEVGAGSFVEGKRLEELNLSRRYNLMLLGVVDRELGDEFIFSAGGVDHKLDTHDVLVVIGPEAEIERLDGEMRGK